MMEASSTDTLFSVAKYIDGSTELQKHHPRGRNSFILIQFSGKIWQIICWLPHLETWCYGSAIEVLAIYNKCHCLSNGLGGPADGRDAIFSQFQFWNAFYWEQRPITQNWNWASIHTSDGIVPKTVHKTLPGPLFCLFKNYPCAIISSQLSPRFTREIV